MDKIGFYEFKPENVDYTPGQLRFPYYIFPNTFKKAEREEVAARIIYFSQQLDEWVGVSLRRLGQMLEDDLEVEAKIQAVRNENRAEERRVADEMRKRKIKNVLTLGINSLFSKSPVPNLKEVPKRKYQFSILAMMPQKIIHGIHGLIEDGYLQKEHQGDEDVFFPTNKLLDAISKYAIA